MWEARARTEVPMREIASATPAAFGDEKTRPVVYDTPGSTRTGGEIDIRSDWLRCVRNGSRNERTDALGGPSSRYGRERLADPKLAQLRFNLKRTPLRAKAGMNVSQMHYARRGLITPEMEFIAIRENQRRQGLSELITRQHRGDSFGAALQQAITPEFVRDEVARGRRCIPANINHPETEPDGDRPHFLCEDHANTATRR